MPVDFERAAGDYMEFSEITRDALGLVIRKLDLPSRLALAQTNRACKEGVHASFNAEQHRALARLSALDAQEKLLDACIDSFSHKKQLSMKVPGFLLGPPNITLPHLTLREEIHLQALQLRRRTYCALLKLNKSSWKQAYYCIKLLDNHNAHFRLSKTAKNSAVLTEAREERSQVRSDRQHQISLLKTS